MRIKFITRHNVRIPGDPTGRVVANPKYINGKEYLALRLNAGLADITAIMENHRDN